EDPAPHACVQHKTVILADTRAPREATLPKHARPPLLGPALGKRAARVSDGLQPVTVITGSSHPVAPMKRTYYAVGVLVGNVGVVRSERPQVALGVASAVLARAVGLV